MPTRHVPRFHERLFKGVAPSLVDWALANARCKEQAAGTLLFSQGDEATDLFILAAGRLKITRVAPDGAQFIVGVLGPGAPAGFVALIRKIPYPASAIALDEVTVLAWTQKQFDHMVQKEPLLGKNALQMIGERAEFMLGRVEEFAAERAEQRLASALLSMIPGDATAEPTVITTRQDLADISGMTMHTASRIIAQWQRQRIIDGGRGRITVRNIRALRDLAPGAQK